jgi:hypothetical protein
MYSRHQAEKSTEANMPMPSGENNKRYHENPQLYRKTTEHIFGTIKRQWGYNHTNLTGLEK